MEQIKAMLEAMEKDFAFGEDIQSLIEKSDTVSIIAAAAEKGFAFTEADWQAYIDWGKSLTAAPLEAKTLAPEELERISGGGTGSPGNPYVEGCWFHAASEPEFRHGALRKRCNQFACTTLVAFKGFYSCACHCTDKCVDTWHYANGC